MPIHDWTKIFDGAFHDFHQAWVFSIKSSLNKGLLPPGYYASMEQVVSGPNADVVTLDRWQAATGKTSSKREQDAGGIAVADCPPRAKYQYVRCAEDSDLLGGFVEIVGRNQPLPEMPLFLSEDHYVNVPLESTYLCAWDELPEPWRAIVEQSMPGQ